MTIFLIMIIALIWVSGSVAAWFVLMLLDALMGVFGHGGLTRYDWLTILFWPIALPLMLIGDFLRR